MSDGVWAEVMLDRKKKKKKRALQLFLELAVEVLKELAAGDIVF